MSEISIFLLVSEAEDWFETHCRKPRRQVFSRGGPNNGLDMHFLRFQLEWIFSATVGVLYFFHNLEHYDRLLLLLAELQIFFQDRWAEVTHGAKNGESFFHVSPYKKWWAHAYHTNHSWHLGSILYLHTDTDNCMHICILTADYTVKHVLSSHSKKKTNYRLMEVERIAECSKWSILQSFRPSLRYHLS